MCLGFFLLFQVFFPPFFFKIMLAFLVPVHTKPYVKIGFRRLSRSRSGQTRELHKDVQSSDCI